MDVLVRRFVRANRIPAVHSPLIPPLAKLGRRDSGEALNALVSLTSGAGSARWAGPAPQRGVPTLFKLALAILVASCAVPAPTRHLVCQSLPMIRAVNSRTVGFIPSRTAQPSSSAPISPGQTVWRFHRTKNSSTSAIGPKGKHLGTLRGPEHPHNMAWGDADRQAIYLTAQTGIYRLRLNNPGAVAFARK